MGKIVIGIDQSYTRTGITVLEDKNILRMNSVNFDGCETNTDKRNYLWSVLERYFKICANPERKEVMVICERIRLKSQGFINENYLKATGALVGIIIDVCALYHVPVCSVDTRAWKSAIVGSSKPLENPYGINPEKYRTILYLKQKGLLSYIAEPYMGRGKKGVVPIKINGERIPCKLNDDLADSYCIALYGFLPEHKQKLERMVF